MALPMQLVELEPDNAKNLEQLQSLADAEAAAQKEEAEFAPARSVRHSPTHSSHAQPYSSTPLLPPHHPCITTCTLYFHFQMHSAFLLPYSPQPSTPTCAVQFQILRHYLHHLLQHGILYLAFEPNIRVHCCVLGHAPCFPPCCHCSLLQSHAWALAHFNTYHNHSHLYTNAELATKAPSTGGGDMASAIGALFANPGAFQSMVLRVLSAMGQ